MSFNPDPENQAQKVIFRRKIIKASHSQIFSAVFPFQSWSSKIFGTDIRFLDSKF